MDVLTQNERGSIWNRRDPHIHTPGTILNDQYTGGDAWENFISEIENSSPQIRALGITDYYSVETYKKILETKKAGRLRNIELIFPNIELRLDVGLPSGGWINFHLLCSPEDSNHVEEIECFLLSIEFIYNKDTFLCDKNGLTRLGKAFDKTITNDKAALETGTNQFKVDLENLISAWEKCVWAKHNILFAVSAGKNDGPSGLQEDSSFTATKRNIESSLHIIFSARPKDREFWLGQSTTITEDEFTKTLRSPKPCLHGSDAHNQKEVGAPDLNRYCWIKGDLTFESLRQACLEPGGRTCIGVEPPKRPSPASRPMCSNVTSGNVNTNQK